MKFPPVPEESYEKRLAWEIVEIQLKEYLNKMYQKTEHDTNFLRKKILKLTENVPQKNLEKLLL